MELDLVRKELNNYDNMIKNMINLRMALIPIVADIKIKNNMQLFQEKREDEIYKNIEKFAINNGLDSNLIKDIYKLIIAKAIEKQESIKKEPQRSIISQNIDNSKLENINQEFKKLDKIIEKEIPEIIAKITKECKKENLNINQVATLYYNNKINN